MNEARGINRLTSRELETLRLVSIHMSSKEIARRLGISPSTVDRHLANAMAKLNVSSRREATRLILEESVFHGPGATAENPPSPSSTMAPPASGGHPPHGSFTGREQGESQWFAGHGLGPVVLRFLIDALLVLVFFAVLAGCASTVHWILLQCEAANVDHNVVLMLKGIHYALVAIDGVGVVLATVLLTFRFLKALKDAK